MHNLKYIISSTIKTGNMSVNCAKTWVLIYINSTVFRKNIAAAIHILIVIVFYYTYNAFKSYLYEFPIFSDIGIVFSCLFVFFFTILDDIR